MISTKSTLQEQLSALVAGQKFSFEDGNALIKIIGDRMESQLDPLHEGCKFVAYSQSKRIPEMHNCDSEHIQVSVTARNGVCITTVQYPAPTGDGYNISTEVELISDLLTEDF